MKKKKYFIRYFIILAVFIASMAAYGGALLNIQFARAEEFQRRPQMSAYTREFAVPAVRGEIYDRNGVPLVTNKNIYDIIIDGRKMTRANYIGVIINLTDIIDAYGGVIAPDSLPVTSISDPYGAPRYSYSMDLATGARERARLDRFLTRSDNKLNTNTSAEELVTFLTAKYRLDEHMPPETRNAALFRRILGICYDFDRLNVLAGDYEYKISVDASIELIAAIKENAHNLPGVETRLTYERVYHYPDSMPHILGRIGQIPEGRQDWYLERGYSLDAIVGISGAEGAFEEFLRGVDGILERTYDHDDILIGEQWLTDRKGNVREPVAGKNVYLTIDINLQQVAEYSIEKTIGLIHALAPTRQGDPRFNGLDAHAGAAAVTDPNNGQVLAIATYPSYNMLEYRTNYNELAADPSEPLFNRATLGLYEPGSVFKIATSVAALCSDTITPNTHITDRGKYTVYKDYQPECWIYSMYGTTHGTINVTRALERSCNYFYFTVGEMMRIGILNEYAKRLGLGERTGIEIGDTAGVLASPEYKEARGGIWVAGDMLQASIGQSDNQCSPLQMANMLSTVVNGGDRYKCSLLLYVKEYGSDEIYYLPGPVILDSLDISEANLDAVLRGMLSAIDTGTGATLFNRVPIRVGGKTGTVQVSAGRSNNATFVAFAPYIDPRLSVSVVIEKGAHGSWAGFVAEDVVEYYFGYKTFEESMDMINTEEIINIEEIEEIAGITGGEDMTG